MFEAHLPIQLSFEVASSSHLGFVREVNEDAVLVERKDALGLTLAVVADGMGGHVGGEIASKTIISVFTERMQDASALDTPDDKLDWLVDGFFVAHERMTTLAQREPALGQMGSTVNAALLGPDGVAFQYAGDSRLYWLRDGEVVTRTRDHSVVQALIDLGTVSEAEVRHHPMAGALVSFIGAGRPMTQLQISPGLEEGAFFVPSPGDVIVWCSDGLWQELSESLLAQLACQAGSSQVRCERLLEAALAAGATDNVSVIVACVTEPPVGTQDTVPSSQAVGHVPGSPDHV